MNFKILSIIDTFNCHLELEFIEDADIHKWSLNQRTWNKSISSTFISWDLVMPFKELLLFTLSVDVNWVHAMGQVSLKKKPY